MRRPTLSRHLKAVLVITLLVLLSACCGGDRPKENCGTGATQSLVVTLSQAEQGAGAVSYQAFGTAIEPTQCKPNRTLSGLQVNDAANLQGREILLIVHHKVPQGLTVKQILDNSDYYIKVNPGDSLTSEQLNLLFDGQLKFPIHHQLAAGLHVATLNDLPQAIYVTLSWFDG